MSWVDRTGQNHAAGRWPMRAAVLAAALLVGLTGCSGTLGPPGSRPSGGPSASTSAPPQACLTLQPRHLEVCTAYVANATLAARYPYYQLGHSTNKDVAD